LQCGPACGLKLILIAVALLHAAFHRWPFRSVARRGAGARGPAWAGIAAVISLACWIGAIACGRLLAYL
jgi:hypothetical protein